ncbi:MAG: hypothetical protein KatS3mg056_1327 [Chloroflexus sp.]|nr:MAG: hypothetical protein KatS3mg056_1327 [Chloroflexus sp.]
MCLVKSDPLDCALAVRGNGMSWVVVQVKQTNPSAIATRGLFSIHTFSAIEDDF